VTAIDYPFNPDADEDRKLPDAEADSLLTGAVDLHQHPQEILEVMEIASVLGIHGVTAAVPILLEEMENADQQP
jgi:hypothetical protein